MTDNARMTEDDDIERVYQDVGADLFGADDLPSSLAKRDADEAAFFALVLVGAEIDNGGFAQFFTNSTGDLYDAAVEGAKRFGLADHVRVLRDAGEGLFPNGVPREHQARLEAWEALDEREEEVDELLDRLDRRWYGLNETLTPRLHDYAKSRSS